MPKINMPKKSPVLDMTPMVDLAFLLVTFFMLTTKFRPEEPVLVDTPSSISEIKLPERDIMMITIDQEGRVFFDVDGKNTRVTILQKMGERYKVEFTPEEIKRFSVLSSFGVPMSNMKQLLNAKEGERKSINEQTKGIPSDSLKNELADWINYGRHANPKFRIAIKGDGQANYPIVKQVIQTLQEQKVNKFNLITNLEEAPKN
ncbi:MAG TPA: biopolymer transporter ExbD [Chryseolinea sp.]